MHQCQYTYLVLIYISYPHLKCSFIKVVIQENEKYIFPALFSLQCTLPHLDRIEPCLNHLPFKSLF